MPKPLATSLTKNNIIISTYINHVLFQMATSNSDNSNKNNGQTSLSRWYHQRAKTVMDSEECSNTSAIFSVIFSQQGPIGSMSGIILPTFS